MKEKKLSIKDIAAASRTSTTTVSFVINGKAQEKNISPSVISRVEAVVSRFNYQPNALAKSFRTGKTMTIGFIVEEISTPFFSGIARYMDEEASKHGYKIIFSSSKNSEKLGSQVLQIFRDRCVDAYVIATPEGLEKQVGELIDDGRPVILFDRYIPDLESDYVLVDNEQSVYNATEHLILNGHKNIAFITIESGQQQMLDRLKGYESAIANNHLSGLVKEIAYCTSPEASDEIASFFNSNNSIDAAIFSCNYLSMDAIDAFKKANILIGKDIAMVSFDDLELLKYYSPSITAVAQPLKIIAQNIMKLLLNRLANKGSEKKQIVTLDTKLEIRDSSKAR